MTFGLTSAHINIWIRFGKWILIHILQNYDNTMIRIPSDLLIADMANSIKVKYRTCSDIWGALDGIKINFSNLYHRVIQNMFYNGWCSDTYINCIFIFGADDCVHICALNSPGALHNSS